MKKVIVCILCIVTVLALYGCGNAEEKRDFATPEWTAYDELLGKIATETDLEKRSLLMHEAEDMLMDTGAVIPLLFSKKNYLLKPDVTGVYKAEAGNIDFTRIEKKGGDPSDALRVCVCSEVSELDPSSRLIEDKSILYANISAGLLKFNEKDELICDLAKDYEISEDGLVYTFHLRDGLKWSDGTDLTADDFVYTFKRAAASENAFEAGVFFEPVKGYPNDLDVVSSENGKVLTVTLAAPCAYFIQMFADVSFFPLPKQQIESAGDTLNPSAWAAEAPIISCGAYTLESWKHNSNMILKKNPYYYAADEVKTEKLELMLSSDTTSIYGAYEAGDLVLDYGKIPSDLVSKLLDDPEFYSVNDPSVSYLIFNVKAPVFADMSVEDACTFRKALFYAIDRRFITDVALMSGYTPAATFVPKEMSDGTGRTFGDAIGYSYPEEGGYYPIETDLDRARSMLRSIGFEFDENGKLKEPVAIEYMLSDSESNVTVATCLQADLAQLGINVTIATREWAVFIGERQNGNFESARGSYGADYNDPYSLLSLFASDSANNDPQLGR